MTKKETLKPASVAFTPSELEALEAYRARYDRSRTDIVREAVARFLGEESALERALAAVHSPEAAAAHQTAQLELIRQLAASEETNRKIIEELRHLKAEVAATARETIKTRTLVSGAVSEISAAMTRSSVKMRDALSAQIESLNAMIESSREARTLDVKLKTLVVKLGKKLGVSLDAE